MDSRYKLFIAFLLIVILQSCGPKPRPEIQPTKSSEQLWQLFSSKYDSMESLALKGSFVISGEKTYETSLQLVYAFPDSFAFLVETILGIDAARGAIVNGIGFWEIPREKYSEQVSLNDNIIIENQSININILLQSVFFFRDLESYKFTERDSYRFKYTKKNTDHVSIIELNSDTVTPISLTLYKLSSYNPGVFKVDYFDWQKSGNSMLIPGRIKLSSLTNELNTEFTISKVKTNPQLPNSLFKSRF